jgi:hypothetical protein
MKSNKSERLDELERQVESVKEGMYDALQKGSWECAILIAQIHDEELYPNAGEKDAFAHYMEARWKVKRSTAYHILSWVKHEIALSVSRSFEGLFALPEGTESNVLDSPVVPAVAPPATPLFATARASRTARSKSRAPKAKHKTTKTPTLDLQSDTIDLSYLTRDDWKAIGTQYPDYFDPTDDDEDDCVGSFSPPDDENIVISIHLFNAPRDSDERDGILLRTEDECVNEFYPMATIDLECGPESEAVAEFWEKFITFVRAYEKRVDLRTALRTKMRKRLEEAHQELGDEAFYGLCGDLTEDLDDAMSEIDEERDDVPKQVLST